MKKFVAVMAFLSAFAVAASGLPAAAAEADPVNITPPTVSGTSKWGYNLSYDPGTWEPADTPLTVEWLRNGVVIPADAGNGTQVRINSASDLFKRYAVRVFPEGRPDLAVTSAETEPAQRDTFTNTKRPAVSGTLRFERTLKVSPGSWSRGALRYKYQWFSGNKPVSGATSSTYKLRHTDVGHSIRAEVTAYRAGFVTTTVTSPSRRYVGHVVDTRKTVTYSVSTRGSISQSLSTFKSQAHETLNDPRGWRANGIAFKRVSSGGSFTLVLSQASKVPSFSSGCSSKWSCRVGRYVIINQDRWRSASSAWKGSLRDYRHMVINHETGHWLEKGHAKCGSRGSLAPVMQQQSISLQGCKFNPWPKSSERYAPRYGF